MDISIIIPVHRRTDWIGRCLENILSQDYSGTFELIIVDDGSPNIKEMQETIDDALSGKPENTRFLRKQQAGPAAARNYGARHATGNILCFLDDDSIPEKRGLQEIMSSFSFSARIGIVSGKTLSFDRQGGLPLLLEKTVYAGKNWATCNIAYRKDVFESVGGFDESFPEAAWEDNDLGLRVRWAGYSHKYNRDAIVYHPHEKSLDEYKKKCLRNGRGASVFSRKYLFKKPFWGIGTPILMSRHLLFGFLPSVWMKRENSESYIKFLWSFYSLQGFLSRGFFKIK